MLTGSCGCGEVTYELASNPIAVHCCHCTHCQKQSGSAYVLNAIIEAEHVKTNGPISQYTLPTPSGKGQVVSRCTNCGTTVFSSYLSRLDKLRYIRVGTLDDPAKCPPDVQIFTSSRQPWVPLNPDIPSFDDFYRFEDVWPDTSLERWRALFGSDS